MAANFHLDLYESALNELVSSRASEKLAAGVASKIASIARKDAPKNRKGSWNMYSRSLSIDTSRSNGTVYALVQADRHPLLVEYGWRDKGGRRHPGRHILKGALVKVREP
ncbi:hypothetical protein [Streptomyces halobius]|uniref:HK97 gp10 family phage protein n=1 Tax=Streptomyces halobius TaxID=2879846 RepID=A0ABY4M379_9ACTN|nr:hypothetical protein [Streptomyces halobius]UQA91319.1 hypothetical protein K9S39_04985 [Streptomyces halobius]UQA91499.1 hypothetical protein K9S39_06110 [Streptomyces halobius]